MAAKSRSATGQHHSRYADRAQRSSQMNDLTNYWKIAPLMQPGDVIAFGGVAVISHLIDVFSGSTISHIAMVQQPRGAVKLIVPSIIPSDVVITESTIEEGVSGPQSRPLGPTLADYGDGARAWWLPLATAVRNEIHRAKPY